MAETSLEFQDSKINKGIILPQFGGLELSNSVVSLTNLANHPRLFINLFKAILHENSKYIQHFFKGRDAIRLGLYETRINSLKLRISQNRISLSEIFNFTEILAHIVVCLKIQDDSFSLEFKQKLAEIQNLIQNCIFADSQTLTRKRKSNFEQFLINLETTVEIILFLRENFELLKRNIDQIEFNINKNRASLDPNVQLNLPRYQADLQKFDFRQLDKLFEYVLDGGRDAIQAFSSDQELSQNLKNLKMYFEFQNDKNISQESYFELAFAGFVRVIFYLAKFYLDELKKFRETGLLVHYQQSFNKTNFKKFESTLRNIIIEYEKFISKHPNLVNNSEKFLVFMLQDLLTKTNLEKSHIYKIAHLCLLSSNFSREAKGLIPEKLSLALQILKSEIIFNPRTSNALEHLRTKDLPAKRIKFVSGGGFSPR